MRRSYLQRKNQKEHNNLLKWQNFILFINVCVIGLVSYYQIEINNKLNDVLYSPSVEVLFSDKRLTIYNRGKASVFLLEEKWPGEDDFHIPIGAQSVKVILPSNNIFTEYQWQKWLKKEAENLKSIDSKWHYYQFFHKFKDHEDNIFIHESRLGLKMEGDDLHWSSFNIGSPYL